MQREKFDFIGGEDQRLSGALEVPDGPIAGYALFAHCFTCTKNSLAATRISRGLARRGIGVLRFDFTGLGGSGGDFADSTFGGTVRDVSAAAAALAAAGRAPTLLVGHSLGGAAVLAAAGHLPEVTAVATIAAPFDVVHVEKVFGAVAEKARRDGAAEVNIGGRPFMIRRAFFDDLARHDQERRISELRRALLIMHAPLDKIVGIENATRIFSAAYHPKSFVSLDGADHLLTKEADAEYAADVISAWASRYFPRSGRASSP